MRYAEWEREVLNINSIEETIKQFRNSLEEVWYIDRHVIDFADDVPSLEDKDGFWATCEVSLKLLDEWHDYINNLTDNTIFAIEPYLIIDDEWLSRLKNAPPPHIFVCLAKQSKYLKPSIFYDGVLGAELNSESLSYLLVGKGYKRIRIRGSDEKQGCWIIMY
jgi:hypothetical protein